MTTDKELLQQALDLLNDINQCSLPPTGIPLPAEIDHVMEALRARLAQPEQEIEPDRPHVEGDGCPTEKAVLQRFWREHQKQEPVVIDSDGTVRLLKHPPQREWQGLTDGEITETLKRFGLGERAALARAIEAKLKEKNG